MQHKTHSGWKIAISVCLLIMLGIASFGSATAQDGQAVVTCTGSLANRLNTVGQTGRVVRFFSTLRNEPAGDPIMFAVTPAAFVVAAPPDGGAPVRCATADGADLFYIYIQYTSAPYAGQQGWAAESEVNSFYGTNQYWLEPYTPTTPEAPTPTATATGVPPTQTPPPNNDCSLSMPNQLNTVGQTGEIAQVFSTLRTAPAGDAIVRVDAPAAFVVAAPPDGGASFRCVDGFVYVYIQYTSGEAAGQSGWALESERKGLYGFEVYYIEPATAS